MVGIRDLFERVTETSTFCTRRQGWSGCSDGLEASSFLVATAPASATSRRRRAATFDGTCSFEARLLDEQCGESPVMALRIAIGILAALRAVLIYGEATELTAQPLHQSRIRRAAQWSPRWAILGRRVLS